MDMGDSHISGRMAGARPFGRAAGDGWIAVGDAAYAPDPLSGMGIELALESAEAGRRCGAGGDELKQEGRKFECRVCGIRRSNARARPGTP